MPDLYSARDWESAPLVAAALEAGAGRRLLVSLGAGDTALGLAITGAEVVACDARGADAALWALKAAGRHLERLEHLQLFGLESAGRRVFIYHRVRSTLSAEARGFWDAHEEAIRTGVLSMGWVEARLAALRQRVPLAHRKSTALALLSSEGEARERFFRQRWEGPRWRAWVALVARELVPSGARRPAVGWLLQRLREVIVTGPHPNGFVEHALTGAPLTGSELPPFLHPAGHRELARTDEVELTAAALGAALGVGPFDGVHLGNQMPPPGLARALRPGALVTRWTLPGEELEIDGLEQVSDSFAPVADPVGVRGALVRWRR